MSEVEMDRISKLPDALVLHILSFLRTTEVVRTCVLSKRWSNMWLYVPSLMFDSREFDSASLNELENVFKFQLFVHSVLLHRKASKLDCIFIKSWYDHSHNTAAVSSWICHAVRCNPRAFTIVYGGSNKLNMPQSIFTCASLEKLGFWLGNDEDREVVMPKIINLPRLKFLRLGSVDVGENCIDTFFSACPFLEELHLFKCFIGFSDICSQKLKSLIIDRCNLEKMLCISTPNLEYLEIYFTKETVVRGVVLQEMGSLYEANFNFHSDSIGIADIPREFVLLSKISNVTCLRLGGSGVVLKALLEKEVPNCSTFHNLRHLYIDGLCISDDFDLVARFFCLLPNLEDLVLRNEAKESAMGKGRGDLARGTLKSKCLKTVEIQYPKSSNVHELERVLLASIEDPQRVRIILSSY